jgi:hypothetical protein
MLSIALGHAADALCHCLGEVGELSATMTARRTTAEVTGTGESIPMTAEDQVAVNGLLEGGAAFAIHYRGGTSPATNLLREINGTEGDLQLTSAGGQPQIFKLELRGCNGPQSSLELLPVPDEYRWAPAQVPAPFHERREAYARSARDYREGTHFCPTFEDAVTRHRMLNAIETAAATGPRQTLGLAASEAGAPRRGPADEVGGLGSGLVRTARQRRSPCGRHSGRAAAFASARPRFSLSDRTRPAALVLRLLVEALGREVAQTLDRLADLGCLLTRSLARVLLRAPLREPALAVQLRHRRLPLTAGCHRSRSPSLVDGCRTAVNGP